jgi:peptidoglycan/LPS O-acetylase OafA/YrhL
VSASDNPFAAPLAPSSAVAATGTSDYDVDGRFLVVGPSVVLPHRCVRCNADEGEDGKRVRKKIYYAPPLIFLLILANLLILLIVYMVVRKPVDIAYSLCAQHRRRKRRQVMLMLVSLVASITCFVGGGFGYQELFAPALVAIIAFLVFAVLASRGLNVRKRAGSRFWIAGMGPEFLASLSGESSP